MVALSPCCCLPILKLLVANWTSWKILNDLVDDTVEDAQVILWDGCNLDVLCHRIEVWNAMIKRSNVLDLMADGI